MMNRKTPDLSGRLRARSSWRAAFRIALTYALVAALWIVLSDRLLLWLYPDAEKLTWLQTVKGWFFVFATALLLAWLVRRDMNALQEEVDVCQSTRERFYALVGTIPHGIQECDPQGIITFTNPGFDRIFGYAPGEAIGLPIWDGEQGEERKAELQGYFAHLVEEQPEPTPYLSRVETRDGRIIDIQVDWDYLRDEGGRLAGFGSIITDVTERIRAEEAIRTSDRLKSELITTAAHEFRTPLTTIQGFAELIIDSPGLSDDERREYLGYIHRKAIDLDELVDNLLDLSRIEKGEPLPVNLTPCSVTEIMAEVAPFMKKLQASHRVEVELEAEQTKLKVDRGRIGQVLENLLSNAAKYSEPGTTIRVSGERHGKAYRLAVLDQGVGMSELQQELMFERFYRVDTSDTSPSGFGIGMAIVRDIVEAHHGEVKVVSSPGVGTTISFELPLPL